ncbi:site-specific integrase, partial [Proteus mirabilis]|nr:site-specific integrase [Proteus mirabilis]
EYRIRNVLDGIVLPKKNKPEIAVMNKKQQLRLEKYLDERPSVTSVGIAISMYMGLRIGEVCALQWKEIDLEKRVLTVSKTIQRVQCRTGSKQ